MKSTSLRSQISRTFGKYSSEGVQTPPAPFTGSAMKAATVSAPSRAIASSSQQAHSPSLFRTQSQDSKGGAVRTTSGGSGPKYFQKGGRPVIAVVSRVPPW